MEELVSLLKSKKMTLSCAESLTAGLFAATLSSTPGVSSIFKGGIVTYWTESKEKVLGVPKEVIEDNGVISAECASYMARCVKEKFNSDVSISFTGNAGPEVMEGKEVGLVYIGLCINNTSFNFKYQFTGDRNSIREASVKEGVKLLLKII